MALKGETGQYTGEHSIMIRSKVGLAAWSAWSDFCSKWHLVPEGKPIINPPGLKEKNFDNPGGDGIFDMTESLTGFPLFNQRTGTLSFLVLHDWENWPDVYSQIATFLHGRNVQMILNDDPEYYYNGRLKINQWASDRGRDRLTIDYNLDPYKLARWETNSENWLWDPFRFFDGNAVPRTDSVIPFAQTQNIPYSGTKNIYIPGRDVGRPVTPVFTLSDGSTCTRFRVYNPEVTGNTYVQKTLVVGENNHFMDCILSGFSPSNQNRIEIQGTGTISITYRAGKL